jgi:uncharacterized protein
LTTFILSGHNATFIPDLIWVGLALFYGGLIQLLAGMWDFLFNTYMLFWSTQVSVAVFLVFLKLEATLILLVIGNFEEAHGVANSGWVHLGGWVGIITAIVAWYASAAGVINGMKAPRVVLPVGAPLHFGNGRGETPMPRRRLHA